MNIKELQAIFMIGETVAVEFKRCGNGIENDTYESVCSFLNRFGGDLFMGVLDDGTVIGVPEKAAPDMVKNFIKVISNPALFSPTIYLVPEILKYDKNRTIIHVHIPPSAEVHSFKKVIYDRVDDADVKVTATSAIAQMYIRKTNLIESYGQLLDFGRKNLPDKFFLEDTVNKSLRNIIVREMISNTLMHREFTSSYTAKFVIEKERMYVENANRATKEGFITVDNLEPNSKNPIIAAFFRNIGYADQLGSGVRKLFQYSKYYSGKDPQFIEDDIFRIIVPLDNDYSFDYSTESGGHNKTETKSADKVPISADKVPINNLSAQKKLIIQFVKEKGTITSRQAEELLKVKQRRARSVLGEMVSMGVLERQGSYKSTVYVLKSER